MLEIGEGSRASSFMTTLLYLRGSRVIPLDIDFCSIFYNSITKISFLEKVALHGMLAPLNYKHKQLSYHYHGHRMIGKIVAFLAASTICRCC